MIPAALSHQLIRGLRDFLRVSFWSSTPGMEDVLERFIDTPGALLKGPYVSVKLPFRQGGQDEFFPELPLGFPAHLHQEQAFARMSGAEPQNTLVATGTGSGKTESFLWPILEHCRQHVGQPGIKAILIYPMNALATDQAGRIAKAIHANPQLRGGAVRAGLYIGESPGAKRVAHKSMGPEHVITDRKAMQLNPPDILLTNYKMLDYLLVRPKDQDLWKHNHGDPLRFLVVDELHTFDGAQGTDLACLIRRLKDRLAVTDGALCCVGTSATLGGEDAGPMLRTYAEDIFGEPFDAASVIGEQRLSAADFFAEHLLEFHLPDQLDAKALDPSRYESPEAYVRAQQALWFEEPIEHPEGSEPWSVALGEQLMRHSMLLNLIHVLQRADFTMTWPELVENLSRTSRTLRDDPALADTVVVSFLSLVSAARAWLPERSEVREAREEQGGDRPTRPFLEVRLQLWQRELARMVADVRSPVSLRFSDDLNEESELQHLPMVHCRDCGAMGWATVHQADKPDVYATGTKRLYSAYFSNRPQVCFLWPAEARPDDPSWRGALQFWLDSETLTRVREDPDPERHRHVVLSVNTVNRKGREELSKDCPFCAAKASLTLVGFRAATLTSVYIDQLFASPFNDDKKLLTFSDSVQDAAHRAGFFGARTWRFNVRVALAQVLAASPAQSLAELADAFSEHWTAQLGPEAFVAAFLPPSMEWMREADHLKEHGELLSDELPRLVRQRLAFEVFTEFSLQSRIGRSFERTATATVHLDPELLESAVQHCLTRLCEEVGGLREVTAEHVRALLLGALHRLRERGGLTHRELPRDFLESGGRDTHGFTRALHLPSYGRSSRLPVLWTDNPRAARFETLVGAGGAWGDRWIGHCLGSVSPLIGDGADIWPLVLDALTSHHVLACTDGKAGRAWGIRPAALRTSTEPRRLRCTACGHWVTVAAEEQDHWAQVPCLTARCAGRYVEEPVIDGHYRRLYREGQVARVFTAEHTGLLTRVERETVEQQFKASEEDRKPWFPNLLSCTPTLEMGIDIGALSSAILCSVPPAQANYLQRIGRAGRRDGNSLLLTIALARLHDLYFYAEPRLMLQGEVTTPGVFLDASAVLERQLAAFCLDRWNADAVGQRTIPAKMQQVLAHLGDEHSPQFPRPWVSYVETRAEELLERFLGLFGERVTAASRDHLRSFITTSEQGSLAWKVLDVLHAELKQRESLRQQANRLKRQLETHQAKTARDQDHEDHAQELERERHALMRLIKQINNTSVLQFLTDQGLLPNYAFPESPIRLRSVIWRKKATPSKGSKYETRTFEYVRPAMAAISELAPQNQFFAGGRRVTIDQVDVGSSTLETWRFCDQCTFSQAIAGADDALSCPNCGSPAWGSDTQKGQLLKLEQVFANTSEKKARIRDERDERQPRFYNRDMLVSFLEQHRDQAWHIDEPTIPFGFEYLTRARFQEINFGEHSDEGSKTTMAGRETVRAGFTICTHCGKVQPPAPRELGKAPEAPVHALWCDARKRDADKDDFTSAVYLYRQFHSEAIRLLLPLADVGSSRELNSFLAAFQLGLRDKYGGRVDHLHTMLYSEPEPQSEGHLRRQYLVLYDTVPGGTGYLKDFTRPALDGDGRHPLMDILSRARDRLTSCTCMQEAERDGCYRCLLAYRNSREMKDTSSKAAVELLERILSKEEKLRPIDGLSSISVVGLMDSVLEARFIEALRRSSRTDRPVKVERSIVREKPGYRVLIGDMAWTIEPQRTLGPAEGVRPTVSIDFVLRAATPGASRKPIAVFLDGFQYHRERIAKDMLQRMTLLSHGEHDVWHFTWHDIDAVFHNDAAQAPVYLHPELPTLQGMLAQADLAAHREVPQRGLMRTLVRSLAAAADPIPWADYSAVCALANLIEQSDDHAAWRAAVLERLPPAARPWFEQVGPDWLIAHHEADDGVRVWFAADPAGQLTDPASFRVLAWLDDADEEQRLDPAFRRRWHGFLHLFQHLRGLPHAWFVSPHKLSELDFGHLSLARTPPEELAPQHGWEALDLELEFTALAKKLAEHGVPLPEVGLDLVDARGHTIGLEGEMVWEDVRVAIVEALDGAEVPSDWTVFERTPLEQDPTPLLAALGLDGAS